MLRKCEPPKKVRRKAQGSSKKSVPRLRGKYGLSVPAAGAMIGLGRNASYEAAKRGDIPTLDFNGLKIVPRIPWMRKLGAEGTNEPVE